MIKNLRRLPLPRKKKTGHPSWNAYSAMKLNLETIKEEIAAFTAYCAQLCFTLLTWQVVLTGRIAYVGLPSNDDRRTYLDRFKKNGTTPQCVEQINYTYDTRILKYLCDKHLVRFAVPEKTGDNVHYFLFKKDNKGNAVLQYKMKRYSFATWPRKYHEGQSYEHAEYGFGTVCDVNLSKIPFPNRIIGKTLCSSLERTDLATKLSSKPMQQNLSSWFSLPVQTGSVPLP